MIKEKAPGKLYIAGEYAVVESGYNAIVMAVDQFITVTINKSKDRGSIKTYDNAPIGFYRKGQQLILDYRDDQLSYVINSINVVESLALELNKDLKFFDLIVDSELESSQGLKYGLGSSAAVTVSSIKALCRLYDISFTKLELFKLAAIVHHKINSNGSGGDLAASAFNGIIAYSSFDKDWLQFALAKFDLKTIITMDWPQLKVVRLNKPKSLDVLIGWTSKPASTTALVDRLNENKADHLNHYQQFLSKSRDCVNNLIEAFNTNDVEKTFRYIKENRQLLISLGKNLDFEIETEKLKELNEIALKYQGVAKSSGAGGGDCGLAFIVDKKHMEDIIKAWNEVNIKYLDLNIYYGDDLNEKSQR